MRHGLSLSCIIWTYLFHSNTMLAANIGVRSRNCGRARRNSTFYFSTNPIFCSSLSVGQFPNCLTPETLAVTLLNTLQTLNIPKAKEKTHPSQNQKNSKANVFAFQHTSQLKDKNKKSAIANALFLTLKHEYYRTIQTHF